MYHCYIDILLILWFLYKCFLFFKLILTDIGFLIHNPYHSYIKSFSLGKYLMLAFSENRVA